jgi:ABC-type transporter Mla subunit MlaD
MAITDTVKDAAYVTIGFGVLGFQKAQVRRVELTKQLEEQLAEGRKAATSLAGQIEGYVAPVRSQLEAGLDSVESTLPATASDLLKQARATLHQQEQVVRTRLGLSAA